MRQIVVLRVADGGIQAAAAACFGNHVPQTYAVLQQAVQPLRVGQGWQIKLQQAAQQRPELIAWVGVILPRRQ